MSVLVETSLGDLTIDLDTQRAPKPSQNFLKLCKLKYFNDCAFYKLQKGFVIECGDPTLPVGVGPASATPTPAAAAAAAAALAESGKPPVARLPATRGGDSVWGLLYGSQARYFAHEPTKSLSHKQRGTLTLLPAPGSKALHSSTFAITLSDDLTYLDDTCAPFGRVVEGMDEFVAKLATILTDDRTHQPKQNIRIRHTTVLEDPFPDPNGFAELEPPASPAPLLHPFDFEVLAEEDALEAERAATLSKEALVAEQEAAEAKSRAVVLEMLGDLPDADAEPPPNVLFVCKLNPITRSEDLDLIFSRFGPIVSCEVIKDQKTGASLQYAFVEFETPESCEQAYFKMNNVLIDQRRIKVDFSQSVAKQWRDMKRKKAGLPPLKAAKQAPPTAPAATAQVAAPATAAAAGASSTIGTAPAAAAPAASSSSSAHHSSSSSRRRSRSRSRSDSRSRHRTRSPHRSSGAAVESSSSSRHRRSRSRSRSHRRSDRHSRSRSRERSRDARRDERPRERTSSSSGRRDERRSRSRDRSERHSSSSRHASSRRRSHSRSRSPARHRRSRSRSPREKERRERR